VKNVLLPLPPSTGTKEEEETRLKELAQEMEVERKESSYQYKKLYL
jgi:hypothetical protein